LLSTLDLCPAEVTIDKAMLLQRGKMVAFDAMKETRDQFGLLTYTIFSIVNPKKLDDLLQSYLQEEKNSICEVSDVRYQRMHRNYQGY
jgi:ABC-type multidrug transport system ATPase subunit